MTAAPAPPGGTPATIGALLGARDAECFVGRARELALVGAALDDDSGTAPRILLVHGPGGIGKSTLLREIARRGRVAGWDVVRIDGRELDHAPGAAVAAFAPARAAARPLVLLDTFELVAGLAGHLRAEVLPALPARAVVVIAGRGTPDAAWTRDGWEHLTMSVPLAAFTRAEASLVLAAGGTTDPDVVGQAIEWTRGSPLAVATVASSGVTAFGPVAEAGIIEHLGRILVDEESAGRHLDALALAAFARTVDRALVCRVLPDAEADEEIAWLAGRTFVERHGARLAMHDLVAHVLRLDLTAREPELVRDLRRRLADDAYDRARRSRRPISLDLAHLVDDPAIRWGFGEGFRTHRLDALRPGDAEVLHDRLLATGNADQWTRAAIYLRAAPELVTVLRDHRDRLSGFTVTFTPGDAPACVADDPQLSVWLAHARGMPDADATVLWLCATNFEEDPEGRAQGLLGLAGFLACRLPHVRRCYLPIAADSPGGLAFSRAAGAVHHPELDHVDGGGTTQCHIADFGPAGALGALLAVVYAEVGAELPVRLDPVASDRHRGDEADAVAQVRHVLRHLHDDEVLAGSPLAPVGVDRAAAAAVVRDRIARSLDLAFVDPREGSVDAQLRAAIEQGYLVPGAHHDAAARSLFLSRATYFRRLRRAIERVAEVADRTAIDREPDPGGR